MSDIVERLLAYQEIALEVSPNMKTFAEAADEIMRLRAELDTKTMNWAANNIADKGEIVRAEIRAAEAIAERDRLRETMADAYGGNPANWPSTRIAALEAERDRLRDDIRKAALIIDALCRAHETLRVHHGELRDTSHSVNDGRAFLAVLKGDKP
jgi:hypothetical protein